MKIQRIINEYKTIEELLDLEEEGMFVPHPKFEENRSCRLIISHINYGFGVVNTYFVYNGAGCFMPVNNKNGYWDMLWTPAPKNDQVIFTQE